MHSHCPTCGGEFSPEPGFFIGAMYISYAFNVAIMITGIVSLLVLKDPQEKWMYFAAAIVPIVLFFPVNFRISRSIYLHLFGDLRYDENSAKPAE